VPTLIDASLWIDFTRARSPRPLKDFIASYILDPEACIAEPIAFEVLRYATADEQRLFNEHAPTMTVLPIPATLWSDATLLGQQCRDRGITPGSLDLLIATLALHHGADLVTFDADFEQIAGISALRVTHLRRPV
jgi:predicted nucleic acid-binding protein